jgi:hypothetical protein
MKIAIVQNTNDKMHSTIWTHPWIEYCEKNSLSYEFINPYSDNILDEIKDFQLVL